MGQFTCSIYYYLKDLDQVHLLAEVCLMGIGIKHYQLMMSLARPFKMEWTFPWAIQRMLVIQEQGVMVRPCILVVTAIEIFALYKDNLCPFHSHYVVFEATIQFSKFVLFLVQVFWRKFELGFGDITIFFRWHPK